MRDEATFTEMVRFLEWDAHALVQHTMRSTWRFRISSHKSRWPRRDDKPRDRHHHARSYCEQQSRNRSIAA